MEIRRDFYLDKLIKRKRILTEKQTIHVPLSCCAIGWYALPSRGRDSHPDNFALGSCSTPSSANRRKESERDRRRDQ